MEEGGFYHDALHAQTIKTVDDSAFCHAMDTNLNLET